MNAYSIFKGIGAEYIKDVSEMKALYPNHYKNKIQLKALAEKLSHRKYPTEDLAEILLTYNTSLGISEATQNNIERLRNGAFTVVSGQQAGIFTGPLYTLYKAISAIKYAREWESILGQPVVPIFWIASEDHDFIEIRSTQVIGPDIFEEVKILQSYVEDAQIKTQRVKWLKKSIGHLIVDESYLDSFKTLQSAQNPDDSIFCELESILKNCVTQRESLAQCFGRMMNLLLGQYGLILFDPMLETVRALEIPFFKSALNAQSAISTALQKSTDTLESMGFKPTIELDPTNSNLFIENHGERLSLKKITEDWVLSGYEMEPFSFEELMQIVEKTPEKVSTNVVLRPVIQDFLFKNLGYVAGPGEMNYYAQLKGVYEIFDQEMPMICPRENFTIIPRDVATILEKYQIEATDFIMNGSQIQRQVLKACDELGIDQLMDALKMEVESSYKRTLNQLITVCPHLEPLSKKNLGRILWQLDYIHEKAHRFHRKNEIGVVNELQMAEVYIMPKGNLQERVLSPFSLANFDVNSAIRHIVEELPLSEEHRFITI